MKSSPEDVSSEPLFSDAFVSAPVKPSGLLQKIARFEREITECKHDIELSRTTLARLPPDDSQRPSFKRLIRRDEAKIEELNERLQRAQKKQAQRDRHRADQQKQAQRDKRSARAAKRRTFVEKRSN